MAVECSLGRKNLELKLRHVLYHLHESQINLREILCGESGELFLQFLKQYLYDLFPRYRDEFNLIIPKISIMIFIF